MSDIYSELDGQRVAVGVIGGSGLYEMDGLDIIDERTVDTPFGEASAPITIASIDGRRVAFLPRHGIHHEYSASTVPYRANIWALKSLGVFWLVTVSAVGSLKKTIRPGEHVVIPDQIIDKTYRRPNTLYEDIAVHVGLSYPFDPMLREYLVETCRQEDIHTHDGGTYVCMEGPAFSTKAESDLHRRWDASLIGMTAMPEARLAREAEMSYATIALPTDYDVWHEADQVDIGDVMANMKRNISRVRRVLKQLIPRIRLDREAECEASHALEHAVVTDQRAIEESTVDQFRLTLGKYLSR